MHITESRACRWTVISIWHQRNLGDKAECCSKVFFSAASIFSKRFFVVCSLRNLHGYWWWSAYSCNIRSGPCVLPLPFQFSSLDHPSISKRTTFLPLLVLWCWNFQFKIALVAKLRLTLKFLRLLHKNLHFHIHVMINKYLSFQFFQQSQESNIRSLDSMRVSFIILSIVAFPY